MGIPKPFQRPSIDLGAPKKEWRMALPHELSPGDIVQGRNLGQVVESSPYDDLDFIITFKNGYELIWSARSTVYAFTAVRSG